MNIVEFKGWSVEEKKMYFPAFPTWNGGVEVWEDNVPQSRVDCRYSQHGPEDQMILLQYTNYDLNGQKIFDGHIIERKYKSPLNDEEIIDRYVVKMDMGAWRAENIKAPQCSSWLQFMLSDEKLKVFNTKIIGDIYQNAEMIEVIR